MVWKTDRADWPETVANLHQPEISSPLHDLQFNVTFVNHATVLIQLKNFNILTDPIWSRRASPLSWIGPKRHREPGVSFEALPKIDLVLISHNHYDHMDTSTLENLSEKFSPVILVPIGDKKRLEAKGIKNVFELDWWDSKSFGSFHVTFTPAQHFSSRTLWDRNESLWGGFVVKWADNRSFFFAGDTGYSPHFHEIKNRLGPPTVAFLPIGAYEPTWFMRPVHMTPADAVLAHKDLNAGTSIGIHFGTFQLTAEAIDKPIAELKEAIQKHGLSSDSFLVMGEGQTKKFD